MNQKTRTVIVGAHLLVLLCSTWLYASNAVAEPMPDTETQILIEGARYTGTINSINAEESVLIIDDRSFVLDRIVRFNRASWSREQVIQKLQADDRVEVEVGPIADPELGARFILSIEVLN